MKKIALLILIATGPCIAEEDIYEDELNHVAMNLDFNPAQVQTANTKNINNDSNTQADISINALKINANKQLLALMTHLKGNKS